MKICQICAVDFTLKTFLLSIVDALVSKGNEVVSVCIEELRVAGYEIEPIAISRSFNILSHFRSTLAL